MSQTEVQLAFLGVEIVALNYRVEGPGDPNERVEIGVDIDTKVFYPKEYPNAYRIIMDIDIHHPNNLFLDFLAVGHFHFTPDTEEANRSGLVNMNSPAIMYPYIRAFVTNFTSSLGGIATPILLPIRFFKGELEEVTLDSTREEK